MLTGLKKSRGLMGSSEPQADTTDNQQRTLDGFACRCSPESGVTAALTLCCGSEPSLKEKLLAPPGGAMT